MLIIARRGKEDLVRAIFDKWDVPCVEIGRVADDGMMRVRDNGAIAAEIKAKALGKTLAGLGRESFEVIAGKCPHAAHVWKMPLNFQRPAFQCCLAFPK